MGVIPLTGVVTPFLSYGGSAMAGQLRGAGLLAALRSDRVAGRPIFAPFRVRALARADRAIGAAAVALVARHHPSPGACTPTTLAIRPHLGMQADGGAPLSNTTRACSIWSARFREARFSIARGLPLATDDAALVAGRADYAAAGVSR